MSLSSAPPTVSIRDALPRRRGIYYGGSWHETADSSETFNPATGASLGRCADASSSDVDRAVRAAHAGFLVWRDVPPAGRAQALRRAADIVRAHTDQLAALDAGNCGNPFTRMRDFVALSADAMDYFAGVAMELKGETVPLGAGLLNYSVREPYGVCARLVAYNHPLMFFATRMAAPIAAGNSVVMKSPQQAPLSAYRLIELLEGVFPPGVLNLVSGGVACGQALVEHELVPRISLIGSVPTGQAIARAAAERLKHVTYELGGKNALVVYPDADLAAAVQGVIDGMNFPWCGQSCGSTSRAFIHESVYDQVVQGVVEAVGAYRPGLPLDPATRMGAIVSGAQWHKVMNYIEQGKSEGARLLTGGKKPADPELRNGWFIEPTIFSDVDMGMRIANEEIFGPVLSLLRWSNEKDLFREINQVEYGLTAAIFTRDLATAHRAASQVESGVVWINHAGAHHTAVSFGGTKLSGNAREESFDELISFTQSKTITLKL